MNRPINFNNRTGKKSMELTSEITVNYLDHMGDDREIALDAKASTGDTEIPESRIKGLVGYLAREGHTSPFEHAILKVQVHGPISMARQWERHRTQSYSELSLRYSESDLEIYMVPEDRPLQNYGNGAHPDIREHVEQEFVHDVWTTEVERLYREVARVYSMGLDLGIANEVVRGCLPLDTMTTFVATANLVNWFRFLRLRNGQKGSPQWEIVQGALQVEEIIAEHFPFAHAAWMGVE